MNQSNHKCKNSSDCSKYLKEFLKNYDIHVSYLSHIDKFIHITISHSKAKSLKVTLIITEAYPKTKVILQLASKTISDNFLTGVVQLYESKENETADCQLVYAVKFVNQFIIDNHLCVCSLEISEIKKKLTSEDTLKLKQKKNQILLALKHEKYHLTVTITIPLCYPEELTKVKHESSNLPQHIMIYLIAQANEVGRQCIVPPLKPKKGEPKFKFQPPLKPMVDFLMKKFRKYVSDDCKLCNEKTLNPNPDLSPSDDKDPKFVIKLYCDDIFHLQCLDTYMMTPPFKDQGKPCIKCKTHIYHEKWRLSALNKEKMWAAEQAKNREYEEMVDFLS